MDIIFYHRLELLMEESNITNEELAAEIEVDDTAIADWLAGIAYPTFEQLMRLAYFFDIPTEYLIGSKFIYRRSGFAPTRRQKHSGNYKRKIKF